MFDWKEIRTGILLAIILGIGGIIWTIVLKTADDITFSNALIIIYETKVKVIFVALFLVSALILNSFLRKKPKIDKRVKEIREFVKMSNSSAGITAKWRIFFNAGEPQATQVTLYCTLHDTPIKLINDICPYNGCANSKRTVPRKYIQNDVESHISEKWEQLNNKYR